MSISAFRNMALLKVRMFERLQNMDPVLCSQLRNMRLPWYTIVRDGDPENPIREGKEPGEPGYPKEPVESDTTDIFIYDEIGGSFGIQAEQFVMDLQEITSPTINVRLNSPGGNVFDAIAIHNALRLHPANVITVIDSLAASAASVIAMAGNQVMAMPGSQIMIHDASITDAGNPAELRELAAWLDTQSDNIATIYAAKTGATSGVWRNRMRAESWFNAQEAVNVGLADKLYTPSQAPPRNLPPEKLPEKLPEPVIPSEEPPDEGNDDGEVENKLSLDMLNTLMRRPHRMTNRGYKYLGRDQAPAPDGVNGVMFNMLKGLVG